MTDFKKGGPLQNSNIYATNRLFVKNPLFKKRKKKRAPGVYNPKGKFKYEDGGENKTKLTKEEEKQFQKFYKTLPENLQSDDNTYDIRGYWDGLGRPQEFDYTQPTESDGYYHAFSINPNTGEYLKSPAHDTFQHAVDEDRKIGYRPLTNVYGRNIATENESIADPEAQTFLRNTQGPVSYEKGGEKGCPPGQQYNPYTKRCEPKLEDRTFLNLMRDRKYGALQQFKLAPKSSYNPKYIQNLKEVTITASKKAKDKKNKKKTDAFSSDYEKLVEQYHKLKNSPLLANQEQANNLIYQIKDIELYNPGSTGKNLYKGERLEDEINNLLDKAQDKASISANAITEDGNDQIDNFRHPQAGRYAAEAIVNYFPEWAQYTGIPQITGFLGANAMGVAHEIGTLPHDERSWLTKLAESGEDIFNNAVGAGVGVLPMSSRDKTNALLELSKQNMLPDGIVDENPANNLYLKKGPNDPGKFKSPYKQELGGSIMDLSEEEIQKYIDGGYVVEEVNDPSIPALTKAAKGGPKSRKLKRNKKEITEVEEKPIEVLDPSEEVFDLPKTQTGELYYEPITTKETTQEELDAIIQYNEEQRALKKEQERLQAIETAKVNEPKYYDEGLQFVKDWHNSPMYNQMVLNSFQGNQKNADYLTSVRKKNLEDLPGLNILDKNTESDTTGGKGTAAWSHSDSGLVEVFPAGYEYGPSVYVHELIHSGDRPRELYKYKHPAYKTGLPIDYFNDKGINLGGTWAEDENNNVINYPDWMVYKDPRFPDEGHVWHNRVIPQTDNLYITTHRGANWKDNEAYKIAQKEGLYSPQGRGEDYYKNKMINDWGYDPNSPDFNTDLQWYVNYDKDDAKQRLKNAPSEWKGFAHGYVSTPHEVRARLGQIRYSAKEEGIYDPFTEQITPEIFQQYINKERDDDNWQPMKPLNDLREDYTDEEILWMLQNISKNKHEKEGDEFAPQSTKYGGSKNKYIEVDIPEKEIQWYIDNGYKVEPVTKLKKFIG
jgi:hypothetical protein